MTTLSLFALALASCGPSDEEARAAVEAEAQRLDTENDAAPPGVSEALSRIEVRARAIRTALASGSQPSRCTPAAGQGVRRSAPVVVAGVLDQMLDARPPEEEHQRLGATALELVLEANNPRVPYARIGDHAFQEIAGYRAFVAFYARRPADRAEELPEYRKSALRREAREGIGPFALALAQSPAWLVFVPGEVTDPRLGEGGFTAGQIGGRVWVFDDATARCAIDVTATNSPTIRFEDQIDTESGTVVFSNAQARLLGDLADRARLQIRSAVGASTSDIDVPYSSGEIGRALERIPGGPG